VPHHGPERPACQVAVRQKHPAIEVLEPRSVCRGVTTRDRGRPHGALADYACEMALFLSETRVCWGLWQLFGYEGPLTPRLGRWSLSA
jgi:hypothetical protein